MIMFIASEVMFFVAWFWAYFEAALYTADPIQASRVDFTGRRLAAEGHRGLRPLAPAAPQHPDPAHLRHDDHLGAPRPAARRPQGPEVRPVADHHPRRPVLARARPTSTRHAHFGFSGSIYSRPSSWRRASTAPTSSSARSSSRSASTAPISASSPPKQHLGFEFAAWYWHFVDVVWLFLFAVDLRLGLGRRPRGPLSAGLHRMPVIRRGRREAALFRVRA